jgi:Mrp family chromosome partitioning ATPase
MKWDAVSGVIIIPSPLDPGASVAFLIAAAAPTALAAGERRWWSENREAIEQTLSGRSISDVTVIFPGKWPERVWRTTMGHDIRIRLISAVYYLWADRLKVHTDAGDIDHTARAKLITRLGGDLSDAEEKSYTPPSLSPVTAGSQAADEAISALLAEPPDPPAGLTVIFGPGGIGKSFFLRKIAAGMAQQSIKDATSGIPVYAELPLLLHTDALETWLSAQKAGRHGLGRLPLDAIRALMEEGVIVPVLDALDELVRGQARDGSRQFLAQLKHTIGRRARGILSSRDYFLYLDPLVPAELGDSAQYLTVGFFDKPGRRRYVQVRAGLSPEHASRWASRLEQQAAETLVGATEEEIEALIGHPLFLDAFCQMITGIDEKKRAGEADTFELRSMDIFDQIVGQILKREYEDKFLEAWQKSPGPQLTGLWNDPFTPELQRRVLRELVLKVAFDGGAEASRRGDDQKEPHRKDYKRLLHGLFTFSHRIPTDAGNSNAVLGEIIQEVLGPPEIAAHVPEAEAEAVRADAVRTLVAAFKSHTLADTQAGQLDTLVFATRHRAYFDYMLAAAVLDKLIESLQPGASGIDEDFVLWCLYHHIVEREERGGEYGGLGEAPFASCLDFVLWHRDAVSAAAAVAESYLGSADGNAAFSEELASYVCSLGLALLLRYGQRRGGAELVGFDAGSQRDGAIRILADVVPAVSDLRFDTCMFPTLVLREVDLRSVTIVGAEFRSLQIGDCLWRDVYMSAEGDALSFHGRVDLEDCVLDIWGDAASSADIEWAPTTKVTLRRCELAEDLFLRLQEQARVSGGVLQLLDCRVIEMLSVPWHSDGRRFVNKLMRLARKDGHPEFGVFREKLRGLTHSPAASFAEALGVLARQDIIMNANEDMIRLTKTAEAKRFSGNAVPGQRSYEDISDFWDPIVRELDEVFAAAG